MPDRVDRCPDRAGLPPTGCPPVDSDGDQVPDRSDDCPRQVGPPEFRGCPDKDSDGDGLIDRHDKCPIVLGPRDLGGCPPADADGDLVPDATDRCPDAKEVWNGRKDGDGCPDKPAALIEVGDGTIVLKRYPKLTSGGDLTASERRMIDVAGRALKSIRAGALHVRVVAEYGQSFGDSLERASARTHAIADRLLQIAPMPAARVHAHRGTPDGNPRVEIYFR